MTLISVFWPNCSRTPRNPIRRWRRKFCLPATTLRRVRALTEAGVIERTVAVLSPSGWAPRSPTIVEITLDVQNAESFAAFARLIEPEPAVMLAWQTAPTVDFTLVLTVRDMPEYQALVQRLFTATNNVRNVRARLPRNG